MTDTALKLFIYDDSLCRIGWSLGFHDRFVESTSDFGRVGESDIGVFAAVDREGRFFCDVAVEGHFGFRSAKTVAQEVIKRDEHKNIPKYFIVW